MDSPGAPACVPTHNTCRHTAHHSTRASMDQDPVPPLRTVSGVQGLQGKKASFKADANITIKPLNKQGAQGSSKQGQEGEGQGLDEHAFKQAHWKKCFLAFLKVGIGAQAKAGSCVRPHSWRHIKGVPLWHICPLLPLRARSYVHHITWVANEAESRTG
eukprot:1155568-Pelagomonas_calceolata.AAC.2